MMGSKSSTIAAGVCGALFVGYCIYFDRKRRSDPNFKNRLRERRRKQAAAKEGTGLSKLPDLKDAEAVQKFFLEEIQLGEELLAQGDYENGVEHLTNAIAVCGQPQQLLQVLQQTLPPPVFQMLLTKLPTISQVTQTPFLSRLQPWAANRKSGRPRLHEPMRYVPWLHSYSGIGQCLIYFGFIDRHRIFVLLVKPLHLIPHK
uniref:Translocase of outer mitochondrial membrane 20 n=1 Tax=Esox lucius TaxID=8010 RepID=A0AAY5KRU0_ESOLU